MGSTQLVMKKFFLFAFLFISSQTFSQQNLFNIPSGDITPKNKWFFQQQINVNSTVDYASKSHFVYGLGKNFEIGANVVNMYFNFENGSKFVTASPFNTKEPNPYYPVGLITAQKKWELKNHFFATFGTQMGTNLNRRINQKRFTHFSYGLLGYESHHKYKFLIGPYLTDWRFVGGGNKAGIIAGFEYYLNKKWILMGDFISGNHKNSVSVLGFTYNVNKHFQLCAGYQMPNPNSKEMNALVLEINLFNF